MTDSGTTIIKKDAPAGRPDLVGDYDEIRRRVMSADAKGRLEQAADAYSAANQNLYDTAYAIRKQAEILAEAWSGEAAAKAQSALQRLSATAWELGARAIEAREGYRKSAQVLHEFQQNFPGTGNFKNYRSTLTAGLVKGEDDQYAQDHLAALNERYKDVLRTGFPDYVSWNLPQLQHPNPKTAWNSLDLGGGGGSPDIPGGGAGGGGGFDPKVPGSGGFDPKVPGSGGFDPSTPGGFDPSTPGGFDPSTPGGFDPSNPPYGSSDPGGLGGYDDPYGGDTSLAGFDPSGVGLGSGGFGPGGGYGGAGLGSGGGLDSGFGPGGAGSGAGFGPGGAGSGAGGFGPGGAGGITPGGPASGFGGKGLGASGTGGRGIGTPMGHGAGGEGEQERERTTWLTEDEDVWGGNTDAAPPVIGGTG